MSAAGIPTRFTARYGTRYPLIQAGMAFAGWSIELAAAISRAGGVGGIGAALLPTNVVAVLADDLRQIETGPCHVNFITSFDHEEQARCCVEAGVRILSFHWGMPSPALVRWLKDAGCDVWQQVGSIDLARQAIDQGADLIIAQGHEAGGHNLQGKASRDGVGTFALIPAMRDALGDDVLLLAAGGIADGRGVAAALHLGADGVSIGTRFVATREAYAHEEYKRRLVEASCADTLYSAIFGATDRDFNPMRVLRNGVTAAWNDRLEDVIDQTQADTLSDIGQTRIGGKFVRLRKFDRMIPTPETEADWDESPFPAGQGVGVIRDIPGAEMLMSRMMADAEAALRRGIDVRG